MREQLYKFSVGWSVILVGDALFMAWAAYAGSYAWLAYGKSSYFPTVCAGTPRLAVAAKVILAIYSMRAGTRHLVV